MLTLDPKNLPFKAGDIVLDLGCGEGRHITGLLETNIPLFIVGLDLSHTDLIKASEKLRDWYENKKDSYQLIEGNGVRLPFKDKAFDHIVCSEVLEHIHDYQPVLSELKRLLKPEGHLCISVPRAWPERICWQLSREYHEVEGGHVRIFNANTLKQEIQAHGLFCYKKHWAHALHSPYWWLKCLFWKGERENVLIRIYHRLLVWDLMKKPAFTHYLEKCLNPLIGKSVVFYFTSFSNLENNNRPKY